MWIIKIIQNLKTISYETSSCNPVTLRQHKLSIPADVASSEKPAGPTNRHRVLCGGLACLLESVHVFHNRNASQNHKGFKNTSQTNEKTPKTSQNDNIIEL